MNKLVYCYDCKHHYYNPVGPDGCKVNAYFQHSAVRKIKMYKTCNAVNRHNDCTDYSPSFNKLAADCLEECYDRIQRSLRNSTTKR